MNNLAQFYKILKADPLGDPWTPSQPDAKPIQNYWCQVEGEELAVSIGKQVGNTISAGQHVYGDLMKATSQKGTNYWKFKSARVPDDVKRPTDSTAAPQADMSSAMPMWMTPLYNMMEYVYKEMKKMDTDEPTPDLGEDLPKGVEPVGEEPIDPETQARLDGIFGE